MHNAWLAAIESGAATKDIAAPGAPVLGTRAFADAVIAHLGQRPRSLPAVSYPEPGGLPETFCTDHWRARFMARQSGGGARVHVWELLRRLDKAGVDYVKTEGLYRFDGVPGYSLGQGQ